MRNAWRAIRLFEDLPAFGVVLNLASIDRTIDIATPDSRMSAYIQAFLDDLYALDASRRAKDSVRYRKDKGVPLAFLRSALCATNRALDSDGVEHSRMGLPRPLERAAPFHRRRRPAHHLELARVRWDDDRRSRQGEDRRPDG